MKVFNLSFLNFGGIQIDNIEFRRNELYNTDFNGIKTPTHNGDLWERDLKIWKYVNCSAASAVDGFSAFKTFEPFYRNNPHRHVAHIIPTTDMLNCFLRIDYLDVELKDALSTYNEIIKYVKKNHFHYKKQYDEKHYKYNLSLFSEPVNNITDKVYIRYIEKKSVLTLSYIPEETNRLFKNKVF